ncbi:MAG TPA: CHAT domain-containing protein [Herpetosiphonaceae bacterium]
MLHEIESNEFPLLTFCAILRRFDRDALMTMSGCTPEQWTALIASDAVVALAECPGTYRLRAEVQADALALLRATRPHEELTLHTYALEYFLQRMAQAGPAEQHDLDAEECLHHLGEAFFHLLPRKEWRTITNYVATVRAARPRLTHHLQRLALYEGYVAVRTQRYDEGETILTDLLAQPELDTYARIHTLNALAQAQWYQTRYDRALALYQQLHDVASETDNLLYQGVALLNMSWVYAELNYHEQALDYASQSLAIFRELHDSSRTADALIAIGNFAMGLGRWHVAQNHFQETIKLYEKLGIIARLANLYWCQGFLHHMLGEEEASESAYRRALEIARSSDYADPAVALDTYTQLGFLYQTQDRWAEAQTAYAQAIDLATHLRNKHWLSLIYYRVGNVFKAQGRLDAAEMSYRKAIQGIEALRGDTEGEEIKIGILGTTQQVYEAMVLLCLERGHFAEAFAYVERARSRAFLDTLAKKSPTLYAELDQPVATLPDVQARLPERALLIEYFTIGVVPRGEHLINKLPADNTRLRAHLAFPPEVVLFALTRDGFEVHRTPLDPNSLRPMPNDPGPGRRLLLPRLLTSLAKSLIEPVQHLLRDRSQLYLIPHGPLHYVPFMALRSESGHHLLDRDGPAIAMAPSATILLHNCLNRPHSQATDFLALGYNDVGERALNYAEAEARSVARLMDGEAWIGPEAKSERLIAEAHRVRWLHIAGHAVYKPQDPPASELHLGADDALTARTIISRLDLEADLVTLSACTSGLSHVVPGDELLGLQRALLYAGAPAVVCTLWEANDLVALLVMERFYTDLRRGRSAAAALRDAQVAVRELTGHELAATVERWCTENAEYTTMLEEIKGIAQQSGDERLYADPFYWAPFMLIGRPD